MSVIVQNFGFSFRIPVWPVITIVISLEICYSKAEILPDPLQNNYKKYKTIIIFALKIYGAKCGVTCP